MLASLAPSALPARAVSFHGKAGDSATGGRFGSYFSEQAALLDGLPSDSPARTAVPPESKSDRNPSNGSNAKDNLTNGITSAALTKSEQVDTIPVATTKTNPPIKPVLGKDKKPVPPLQSKSTESGEATPTASPVASVPVPKPIFGLGFSLRGQSEETAPQESENPKVAVHSAPTEPSEHSSDHALNPNVTATTLTPLETGQLPPASDGLEDTLDDGQKVAGGPQLPQSGPLAAQDSTRTGAGRTNQATELAFASRIQDSASASLAQPDSAQKALPSQPGDARADQPEPISHAPGQKPAPDEEEHKASPVKTETAQNPQSTAYAYNSRDDFKAQTPDAQPARPVTRTEMPITEADQAKPAAPLKDLTFQVNQSNERVEVRIVQQAGEVRVAVRTGDTDLVHGLQQNLSDLSGKLQQSGYHADTWRPGIAAETMSSGNDSRKGSGDSGNGQPQPQSGGSQHDRSQQNQNRSNRPRWVDEMESTLKTGEESTGVTYGFGS